MTALKTLRKDSSWSRSLRDSDDDSCDDAAPPPRSSRQTRTRTTSSDTDGFTWGAGIDAVDIGLVSEPAGLHFIETPFTLAKRTGARRNCGGGTDGKGGRRSAATQQPPRSATNTAPLKLSQPLKPPPTTATHKTPVMLTATAPVDPVDQLALHPHPTHPPPARPVPSAPAPQPSSPTPLQAEVSRRAKHLAVEPSSSVRMVVESSTASTADDAVLTPISTLVVSPAPAAPCQPRTFSPLHIRTDSPSPELPSFQAPLLRPKAVRPAKRFVSPVRFVKQLPPPVKPASAPLAAPTALLATVLPVLHDAPRGKPPPSQITRAPAQEAGPSQVASTPSRSLPGGSSKARLERFRHIGTFSSTGQWPPPASPATPSAVPPSAVLRSDSAPSPHNCSASPTPSSFSSEYQPTASASASSSNATATPSVTSSTFRLPGLAPVSPSSTTSGSLPRPAGRLAFAPAESLAAFRARMAGASAALSPSSSTGAAGPTSGGRKRARDAASAEDGSGRERLVLGTAVRSVRPVSLASTGASGRARGGGMGRSVGARAAPRLERAQDGAESGEARLRRLYRSLEG
ncbi:hypothetical protein JCM10449v2_006851 [Rhodotorula kratochvilovae]